MPKQQIKHTCMASTEFEPKVPAIKQLKTYALDLITTGIGYRSFANNVFITHPNISQ